MKGKRGRLPILDKFNQDPKSSDFIKNFQQIMIQRLNLNHTNRYSKTNVERIVQSIVNRSARTINTQIKDDFLLTCKVEPELYINIQETAKKITGDYIAMDELIYLLLTYFCNVYKSNLPKNELPYKHVNKGRSKNKLLLFQNRFEKYYSNIVHNFME